MTEVKKLFRYVPEQYLKSTSDGNVLFRSLSYYRDFGEDANRGDNLKGHRVFRPESGLEITIVKTGKKMILPQEYFMPMAKCEDIYVSCMSTEIRNDLFDEFKTTVCVEIIEPNNFIDAIQKAITEKFGNAISDQLIARHVDYYNASDPIGATWALPEKIVFCKENNYSRQAEFRIAFPTNGAFKFQNVKIEIGDITNTKRGQTKHNDFIAAIGNIRDITIIHRVDLNN